MIHETECPRRTQQVHFYEIYVNRFLIKCFHLIYKIHLSPLTSFSVYLNGLTNFDEI